MHYFAPEVTTFKKSCPWNLRLYLKSKTANILWGPEDCGSLQRWCWCIVGWESWAQFGWKIFLNQTHPELSSQYHTLPIILVTSMLRISIRHKSHGYFETHLKQVHQQMNTLWLKTLKFSISWFGLQVFFVSCQPWKISTLILVHVRVI